MIFSENHYIVTLKITSENLRKIKKMLTTINDGCILHVVKATASLRISQRRYFCFRIFRRSGTLKEILCTNQILIHDKDVIPKEYSEWRFLLKLKGDNYGNCKRVFRM